MPRERFTYTVDFPGLRAPGLDVGRLIAAFDVTDYTGTTEDRALAMRELVAAAVTMACRRLAAEQPELLRSPVAVDRAEGSLALRLPTWFKGAPPESLVRLISEALANAAWQAGGQAAARLVEDAVAALDPEERIALKQTYEAAAAALREGNHRRGMQLLNRAEQQRAWHQAALQVGADLPAAAGAVRRTMPPMVEIAAEVERVLASVDGRVAAVDVQVVSAGAQAPVRDAQSVPSAEHPTQTTRNSTEATPNSGMTHSGMTLRDATGRTQDSPRPFEAQPALRHASPGQEPGAARTAAQSPGDSAPIRRDAMQVHADPRNAMQVHADPRNSMPVPHEPMQVHASPRNSMPVPHEPVQLHADPRNSTLAPHESVQLHADPRNSMLGSQNSMLGSQNSMPGPQNSMLGPQNSMPGPQNSMPGLQDSMLAPHDPVPSMDDSMRTTDANRESAKAIEANRESTKAIEGNRDSTKAIDANRESAKAIEANRDSTKAIEANRDSAKAIEGNRDSAKEIEANRDSAQAQPQAPQPRPNALIPPTTPPAPGGRPAQRARPQPDQEADAGWLADLAREAEALLWAPGPAETKAVLLAALLGPLPPELLAVPLTARPPQATKLTKQQARAATRSLEAYLDGLTPAEALQPPRRRRKP